MMNVEQNMVKPSSFSGIQEAKSLIIKLESLITQIQYQQKELNTTFEKMINECNTILSDAKVSLQKTMENADLQGFDAIPDIPIDDNKLKRAWIILFKHHLGATAEEIAIELRRHRTTVSTYLNTLVLMGYATKERIGHEIYYKATLEYFLSSGKKDILTSSSRARR